MHFISSITIFLSFVVLSLCQVKTLLVQDGVKTVKHSYVNYRAHIRPAAIAEKWCAVTGTGPDPAYFKISDASEESVKFALSSIKFAKSIDDLFLIDKFYVKTSNSRFL